MFKFILVVFLLVGGWFFIFHESGQNLWHHWFVDMPLETQKEDLLERKKQLEEKISSLSEELETKKDDGIQRIEELETSLKEAQQSYKDIVHSIHRFQRALDLSKPLSEQDKNP